MSYAVSNNGATWRAVNNPGDCAENETWQESPPDLFQQVPTYADLRRAEYPPIADFIDGLVKDDQNQIAAYKAACLAVKAKYPKP